MNRLVTGRPHLRGSTQLKDLARPKHEQKLDGQSGFERGIQDSGGGVKF